MSKVEYLSPEGFRIDGRRANELRSFRCKVGGVSASADGSAYVEDGNTKVISYVYGPAEVRRSKAQHDKAVIACEVSIAPFSTPDRKRRSRNDRNIQELSLVLRQIFEGVVILKNFPRSQIAIFVHVIEGDGGVRSAAINACCLALVDAGVAMRDLVVSCNATYMDSKTLIDANQIEINAGGAELTLAVHVRSNEISFIHVDSKLPLDAFHAV